MAELVTDCPRCDAQVITFNVFADCFLRVEWDWQSWYESFAVCRACHRSTIFVLSMKRLPGMGVAAPSKLQGAVNDFYQVEDHISMKDESGVDPPEHVPEAIAKVFTEGATSIATGCWNAAGTMFRLCVDLATRELLPPVGAESGPNAKQRRDLGLRLPWLFDNGLLPANLRDLSSTIKEDGNDGAHQGTLTKEEAEDMLDFTETLLERLYTESARVRLAQERREARRASKEKGEGS